MLHKNMPASGRHPIHSFEYANAAARTGAVGFVAGDVYKVALQLDTNAYWILTNHSPVTWVAVAGAASAPDWADIQNKPADFTPSAHNHDAAYEPIGAVATHASDADPHSNYAFARPPVAQVTYNAGGNTTVTLDGRAEVFYATAATGSTTWGFTGAVSVDKVSAFTLELTNGGSQTQNWPASVDWDAGVAPTLTAAGVDILTFYTRDGGTTWYGFLAAADIK